MKKIKFSFSPRLLIIIGLILLSIATGLYFYPYLPYFMPTHWNLAGEVDATLPKLYGLAIMPGISIIMFIFYLIVPKIPVMGTNIDHFRKHYDNFMIVLFAFLYYIYLLSILWSLDFQFNFIQVLAPAFSGFIAIGFLVENAEQNPLIGIRTPWTLHNKTVWDKTHKMGAGLFKTIGIIALLGVVLPDLAIWFILAPVILVVIYTFVYSYLVFHHMKKIKK